jgi:hypothetical protein
MVPKFLYIHINIYLIIYGDGVLHKFWWTPPGVLWLYKDSTRSPGGVLVDFGGVLVESWWSPGGVLVDSW